MRQIDKLERFLNDNGFSARQWKYGRIYLNGFGKDIKAFVEMDIPDCEDFTTVYDGCKVEVYSNANQSYTWIKNRQKQVRHSIALKLEESGLLKQVSESYNQKHSPVPENWQDMFA
jgi:hypothetical protein